MNRNRLLESIVMVALIVGAGGCGKEEAPPPATGGQNQKAPATVEQPRAPLIPKPQLVDWCKEHLVPESVCTRCNDSLIAEFKQKGDWCAEHGLPESQCVTCHPELEAKFKAMEPKSGGGQ